MHRITILLAMLVVTLPACPHSEPPLDPGPSKLLVEAQTVTPMQIVRVEAETTFQKAFYEGRLGDEAVSLSRIDLKTGLFMVPNLPEGEHLLAIPGFELIQLSVASPPEIPNPKQTVTTEHGLLDEEIKALRISGVAKPSLLAVLDAVEANLAEYRRQFEDASAADQAAIARFWVVNRALFWPTGGGPGGGLDDWTSAARKVVTTGATLALVVTATMLAMTNPASAPYGVLIGGPAIAVAAARFEAAVATVRDEHVVPFLDSAPDSAGEGGGTGSGIATIQFVSNESASLPLEIEVRSLCDADVSSTNSSARSIAESVVGSRDSWRKGSEILDKPLGPAPTLGAKQAGETVKVDPKQYRFDPESISEPGIEIAHPPGASFGKYEVALYLRDCRLNDQARVEFTFRVWYLDPRTGWWWPLNFDGRMQCKPLRYRDNGDGSLTDIKTGLRWKLTPAFSCEPGWHKPSLAEALSTACIGEVPEACLDCRGLDSGDTQIAKRDECSRLTAERRTLPDCLEAEALSLTTLTTTRDWEVPCMFHSLYPDDSYVWRAELFSNGFSVASASHESSCRLPTDSTDVNKYAPCYHCVQ